MTEQQKIETPIKYPNRTKKVRAAQPVKAEAILTPNPTPQTLRVVTGGESNNE